MNLSLTPQLKEMIRDKVASSRYNNSSEVVREALRLLEERDIEERLRAALAVGIEAADRGDVVEWTPELMAEIDREVDYRPVEPDGAARAAALIAPLLEEGKGTRQRALRPRPKTAAT